MILRIKSTSPFEYGAGKKALKMEVVDESDNAAFNATSWGHKLETSFTPDTRIEVKENDAISWKEFKGKNELSISYKADVAILSSGGAAQRPAGRPAPQRATVTEGTASGENVMARAAELTRCFYDELVKQGFDHDAAVRLAHQGPRIYPAWFFGEKGGA